MLIGWAYLRCYLQAWLIRPTAQVSLVWRRGGDQTHPPRQAYDRYRREPFWLPESLGASEVLTDRVFDMSHLSSQLSPERQGGSMTHSRKALRSNAVSLSPAALFSLIPGQG